MGNQPNKGDHGNNNNKYYSKRDI
jgi:hypothetical protein